MKDIDKKNWLHEGWKRFLFAAAIISLACAYLYGCHQHEQSRREKIKSIYKDSKSIKRINNYSVYAVREGDTPVSGYISITEASGWGGPLLVATKTDPEGVITSVDILEHRETPAYLQKLNNDDYFDQFTGKKVNESFVIGDDIDAVSGATLSSKGFNRAIREGSRMVATRALSMEIPERDSKLNPGIKEMLLSALFIVVVLGSLLKIRKSRYLTMAAGLVLVGFYMNFPLSISNLSSIILGYIPMPNENLLWWIMIAGVFIIIGFTGKNLYCYWICPFGALQEFLGKISGISLKIPPRLRRNSSYVAGTLTWLGLMIIFITRNPSTGNYEPFAAMFGFHGEGVMWYILPLVLFGSLFIRRFWCRFFCPVGFCLSQGCRLRNHIVRKKAECIDESE